MKISIHVVQCFDKCLKPEEIGREVSAQHNVRMDHRSAIVFQYFLQVAQATSGHTNGGEQAASLRAAAAVPCESL